MLQKQPAGYASDVYAWAVTVNEVATGVFPFSDCIRDNPKAHTVLDFGYGRCNGLPRSYAPLSLQASQAVSQEACTLLLRLPCA